MKISQLDVHHVQLPLKSPWHTAYGIEETIENLLIKAYSNGAEIWVETCPLKSPLYSPESARSAFQIIVDFFAPIILNKELDNSHSIPKLLNAFRGNSFAKAGVEQCWWALESKEKGIPLHQLIGGKYRDIEIGKGFGIQPSTDILLEKIESAINKGTKRIKLKIREGWDLEIIKYVRDAFPDIRLMADCNGSYTLSDIKLFKEIDSFKLEMIEQPFFYRDFYNHSLLQKELKTPICLDESITCLEDAKQALDMKSCKIINVKPGRVGGISPAIDIHDMCMKRRIPCWVGGMMESSIGTACNIELATLCNFTYTSGITLPSDIHTVDIIESPIEYSKPGIISPSKKPYIGQDVNEEKIEEITLAEKTIR